MSSSYKPALLKALVRIVPATADVEISFKRLGAEFLRLYWTQTVVFRLRQASSLTKEPEAVQEIRRVATANRVRDLAHLAIAERTKLQIRLARVLPINVIDAFHASKRAAMPLLFNRASKGSIRLSAGTPAFLRENAVAKQALANLWWASYLEKVNQLAPLIIQKVERDGARRTPVAKYFELLRSLDGPRCFYCERTVSGVVKGHVDHVIPWSFMLLGQHVGIKQDHVSKPGGSRMGSRSMAGASRPPKGAKRALIALPSRGGSTPSALNTLRKISRASSSIERLWIAVRTRRRDFKASSRLRMVILATARLFQ
jgi:hypothetical protein